MTGKRLQKVARASEWRHLEALLSGPCGKALIRVGTSGFFCADLLRLSNHE